MTGTTIDYHYYKSFNQKIMKTTKLLFAVLVCSAAFTSCKKDNPEEPKPVVLINGVRWAECNVDAPGTFAASPQALGMFYKWGTKIGWSATGDPTSTSGQAWADVAAESGDNWLAANDPCPAGWRLPTKEELATLLDDTKVTKAWVTTPANGYKFTDQTNTSNSIFLPAAGYRYYTDGTLGYAGDYGFYWSSTMSSAHDAWGLSFYSGDAYSYRTYGFTVRCVLQ